VYARDRWVRCVDAFDKLSMYFLMVCGKALSSTSVSALLCCKCQDGRDERDDLALIPDRRKANPSGAVTTSLHGECWRYEVKSITR